LIKKIKNYFSEGLPDRKNFPEGRKGFFQYIQAVFSDLPPGIGRIMKIQPVFALISGLTCIFLLRKGFAYAPIIIFTVVLAIFYIIYRLYRLKGKKTILKIVWDFALLIALNDMLFFVIPFYFESMTFFSRNIIVAPVIVALSITANQIYIYKRWVARSPFISAIFYSLTFFFSLNIIFPIIFGMRNIYSIITSGAIAATAAIAYVYPHLNILKNKKNTAVFISGIILFFVSLWFGRSFIPPSPLKLTNAAACEAVFFNEPANPFTSASYEIGEKVYFFSAIFAPRGLREQIYHVWYYNDRIIQTVNLKEIDGGRDLGYRTWSLHTINEGPGRYAVEVWTAGGQLLGRRKFVLR
jgi:hypothetical protein